MSNDDEAEDTLANLLPGDTGEREQALFDMIIEKFSENLNELRENNKEEMER